MTEPLLVTGAHRSGSTWVGRMLAAGNAYAYVSEPLNVHHRPGVMRQPVAHWYQYICPENEERFLTTLRETVALRYHLGRELLALRSAKDIGRMFRDGAGFTAGRWFERAALLKDPFATFSAPWFAERLGCRVLYTVRHPAAFASSLKRLGWTFNFRHLLDQPLLIRDHLAPFEADMREANRHPDDLILRASTLWRVLYKTIHAAQQAHPAFIIAKHEDLSRAPRAGFQELYAKLGIAFNSQAQATLHRATAVGNPIEAPQDAIYSVHVDSRANISAWMQRLEADEIARIRDLTADTWPLYYSENDWNA
jgi:hypothetical protein